MFAKSYIFPIRVFDIRVVDPNMETSNKICERGEEVFIADSGKFSKDKILKSNETFWSCAVRSCKSKTRLVWKILFHVVIWIISICRNHKNVKSPNYAVKKRSIDDSTEGPLKIHSVLKNKILNSIPYRFEISTLFAIVGTTIGTRQNLQPRIPKTTNGLLDVIREMDILK